MINSIPAISSDKLGNYSPPKKKLTDKQLTEAFKYISVTGANITPTRFQVPQKNLQGRKAELLTPSISLQIFRE